LTVDFKLYLITDRKQTKQPLLEAVRLALQGGVRAIQLREKDLPIRELLALALEMRRLTNDFGAKLFINDRVDVAVAVKADGVHLGHQSMPPQAVKKIVGNGMLIGVSTHNLEEAIEAEKGGADFITLGPVFVTPSKAKYGAPIGPAALREVKKNSTIPIFGLGGIMPETIDDVLQTGVHGIGMISAIFGAEDIQNKAKNIMEMIQIVNR